MRKEGRGTRRLRKYRESGGVDMYVCKEGKNSGGRGREGQEIRKSAGGINIIMDVLTE